MKLKTWKLRVVWFVVWLYSFSIFIFCTHFLYSNLAFIFFVSIYFFAWYHFLLCLPFTFFFDNQQHRERERERERERVLWCDKSVIVRPTNLIFLRKMSQYSFLRKWKHQKIVFIFVFKSFFFFFEYWKWKMKNEKWKLNTNTKPNKFFSSRSHKKLKMNTKYTSLLLKQKKPWNLEKQ